VIMGRLIPAGTGMAKYQDIGIRIDAPEELLAGPDEDVIPVPDPSLAEPLAPPAAGLQATGDVPPGGLET
jgi:hypothetical protein